jgi:pimeloyl-ACP methyl ester carboxylesterase
LSAFSGNLQERLFDAGGVKINYAEGPKNGRPLILLHGLGRSWQDFAVLIPRFSSYWHVYAVDMRGHGKSGHVPRGYTSAGYAAEIVRFVRDLVAEPAILFGHSMGGVAAVHVAAQHPDIVLAVILGDNPLSGDHLQHSFYRELFVGLHALAMRGGTLQELAKGLANIRISLPGLDYPIPLGDLPGNDEAYLTKWAESLRHLDPEVFAMTLDGSTLADFESEVLLPKMRCPTLIMQASPELGGLMTDEEVERAMRLLPRPKLVKFPLLGHALHLQQPQPVIKAVSAFLDSL